MHATLFTSKPSLQPHLSPFTLHTWVPLGLNEVQGVTPEVSVILSREQLNNVDGICFWSGSRHTESF